MTTGKNLNAEHDFDLGVNIDGCESVDEPHLEKKRRVLFIGMDGTRADALIAAQTPTIDRLIENGRYSMEAMIQRTGYAKSAPGWNSIFLGVDPIKLRVFSNDIYSYWNYDYKSFFWHVHNDFKLKTLATIYDEGSSKRLATYIEEDAVD